MTDNVFIFDMDGTVCASGERIDYEMEMILTNMSKHGKLVFVSGASKEQMLHQLGFELWAYAHLMFPCSTGEVWQRNKKLDETKFSLTQEQIGWLFTFAEQSGFDDRGLTQLDMRTGLANFSIVGRKCTMEQRFAYIDWDRQHQEREQLVEQFNARFDDGSEYASRARVAGETGVDISKPNVNKGNVLTWLNRNDDIYFWGDKCGPGGNDYDLAVLIDKEKLTHVWGVSDTKSSLWNNYQRFFPEYVEFLKKM